jgi:hypothetical protein
MPYGTARRLHCTQGLAHCFEKDADSGKLVDRLVLEPLGAPSVECLANGVCPFGMGPFR